jgi:hypothetical protein
MRECSTCHVLDRPQIDQEVACRCGAVERESEDHDPKCPRLVHEVRRYIVRVNPKELTPDKKLSSYFVGWEKIEDGGRIYRFKYLCRQCIRNQEDALSRKQDYQKACKAARGVTDQTYAQMLAAQGS